MNDNPRPEVSTLHDLLIEMAEVFEQVVATLEQDAAQNTSSGAEALKAAERRLAGLRERLVELQGPAA